MTDVPLDQWNSLSRYLDEALELEPSQRAEWILNLSHADAAMAARIAEVFALREEGEFSSFLAAPPPLPELPIQEETLVGRKVGPYVIEAQIGRGGMGSVWRARRVDERYQGIVAVKFVHAVWVGQQAERRFRIEGNLLGRLSHPNIARLIDAGVLEGSQPYLIIEHVEGESIDRFCERRQLGLEFRIRLFLDVLAAVAHAHSQLVVHRDIKPANIFVNRDGTVKLLDFGIGKLLDAGLDSGTVTLLGDAALTPQYASPEQLLGRPVSAATDVYALGVVLYVLLSGEHPLAARAQHSNAEWIQAVASEVPAPASTRAAIRGIARPALEGDIDNILHKALKKDPLERYGSAGAFAEDLQRYLKHEPVYARADTLRYRTQKFVRRHRSGVVTASFIAAALLVGFVGTLWEARRADANARQAERARQRALEQLDYADATNELFSNLLEQGSGKPFTTPELLARGEELVNQQFKNDPRQRARLLLTLADLYAQVQEIAKSETVMSAAQKAAESLPDESLHIQIDCSFGLMQANHARFEESLELLNSAIARARGSSEINRAILADCLNKRSQVERVHGESLAAVADAKEAIALLGTPRAGQSTQALTTRATLASAEAFVGDRAEALHEYERVLADLSHMGRGRTEFAVTLLNDMGIILSKAGQWVDAARVYENALVISRSAAGGGEISPMTQTNYAKLLIDLGRARDALTQFDQAMISARNRNDLFGTEMIDLLSAPAMCALGNLDECASRLERSGNGLRQQLKSGNATLGTHETELAELAVARARTTEAEIHLDRALAIFRATAERNPNEMRALAMRAELKLRAGEVAAAATDADLLMQQAQSALTGFSNSVWVGRAFLVQGEVRRAQGSEAAAEESFKRALDALRASAGDAAPWTRQAHAEFAVEHTPTSTVRQD